MRILIVNQVFYPDETAVSQYITDLAEDLAKKGYEINVLSGIYDYEKPNIKFRKTENYCNMNINRIGGTNFKTKKIIPRAMNFFTYICVLSFKLIFHNLKQYDIIIASSVPPLSPLVASAIARFYKKKFIYWCMDLQPDAAIAMQLVKKKSILANSLFYISKLQLKGYGKIVVLDNYMKEKMLHKNVDSNKVISLPLWPTISVEDITKESGKNFRKQYKFDDKFIIMYSGNHSLCHPLDTLLKAAVKLKDDDRFLFLFIGSGVRCKDVLDAKKKYKLDNIVQLPYQLRKNLLETLCAADLHIAVMGNSINGLMHPSKSYSIISTGKPFVFIGPEKCYISDLINASECGKSITHNDVDLLIKHIEYYYEETEENKAKRFRNNKSFIENNISRKQAVKAWEELLAGSLKNSKPIP